MSDPTVFATAQMMRGLRTTEETIAILMVNLTSDKDLLSLADDVACNGLDKDVLVRLIRAEAEARIPATCPDAMPDDWA